MIERAAKYLQQLKRSQRFWKTHAIDQRYGGFWSCLDRGGAVYDERKYVWMAGRAVWMFSKLGDTAAAEPVLNFLMRHGRDPEGRFYFSLNRNGSPASFQRKPYGAVFAAIGLAEYARSAARQEPLDDAAALFWKIREWIADPTLLGRPRHGLSQLADVMVTISMLLEIMPSHDDPRHAELLNQMLDEALAHQHPELGVFVENIRVDRTHFDDSPTGRLWCPGHALEVSWFLLRILDQFPDTAKFNRVLMNIQRSLELGWDSRYDGLFYFLDTQSKPMLELEWDMKLWWPHTEAILALAHAWRRTGDAKWAGWLDRIDEYAWRTFVDDEFGEWFGYASREGRITHDAKGNSYKGFFHVPRAMMWAAEEITAVPKK